MRRFALLCCVSLIIVVPAVSPAGAAAPSNGRIVFCRQNPAVQDCDIVTANPDGSDEVLVVPGPAECPRWSPDGDRILLASSSGMATIAADGSDLTPLANPDPSLFVACGAWSPDGTRLAREGFSDDDPTRNGIYLTRADGTNLERVTFNPDGGSDTLGDFSPDGSRIVFVRFRAGRGGSAVFVVDVDGSQLRQITPWGLAAGAPRWSPDGSQILFAGAAERPKGPLWLVHPDGTGLRKVFQDSRGGVAFLPTWSPDGTQILFALNPSPRKGVPNDLYRINADGSGLTQVTDTPDFEEAPDWGTAPVT